MKRKFLSILLTLAMALTLLPTAAMAEDTDGVECSDANCSHVVAVRNDGGNGKLLHYSSLNTAISKYPRIRDDVAEGHSGRCHRFSRQ